MRQFILNIIDFFYKPFEKFMPLQTFRYLACGGSNTLLDIVLYSVMYHFVLHKNDVHLFGVTISAHIAALFMSLAITFPTGFLLSKFIVFTNSSLEGRVQLFRYFVLVAVCFLLNYVFMKLFVNYFHFFPTVSKIFTTFFVVAFSYLTQKKFTFKTKSIPLP
ncbi:Putative flippase GtrA (transmembrane translocase of bactoprenol-linked glucose) [Chitinophaga costaii]|uniref:Putative flippase GtrA (Transmembrane translocase of bactoprenol-linked glucose) n=1 Tax=Chitinophaga costaii TaxID=1335309 RepID=A0A1C3ZZL7_9BACT|nr:GtrA family protein [Chitinophaga costaii]PUZ30570.1 GtrA family protein [Chitinophaga costaii]SCB87735.1 Putative flippase GtrA (transmembrane translocase of bactoprenol-linked glucose) [Chitinophaga costaii]